MDEVFFNFFNLKNQPSKLFYRWMLTRPTEQNVEMYDFTPPFPNKSTFTEMLMGAVHVHQQSRWIKIIDFS